MRRQLSKSRKVDLVETSNTSQGGKSLRVEPQLTNDFLALSGAKKIIGEVICVLFSVTFLFVGSIKTPPFSLISLCRYSWSKTPLKLGNLLSLLVDFGQAKESLVKLLH